MKALYALSHGIKPVNPANHLYGVPKFPEGLQTRFYFWAIQNDAGGITLVDQGCSSECLEAMGIPQCLSAHPLDLLASIGIKPEDVSNVIISHLHWDHYAGEDFFPKAHYFIHQKELDFAQGPESRFRVFSQHCHKPALERLKKLERKGRLTILSDEQCEIEPGITAIRLGGHTPGLLAVEVKSGDAEKLICGDVMPRRQNLEEGIPCGIHYNVVEALEALEKIAARVKNVEDALPGHDPLTGERHPEARPGVYRIF